MCGEVIEQRLLVSREPEEMVFLLDPLRHERRVQWTSAVDEILLLLERFAADAIPTLVHALVNVAGGVNPVREVGHPCLVAWLGGADEVVERHVEMTPCPGELLLHAVAVRQRIEPLFDGAPVHVLRVFVVAHEKAGIEAGEPLVPGDDVGAYLLVRRAEMRPTVDVVDGRRQEESAHDVPDRSPGVRRLPYACITIAWTSLTERL